MAYKVPQGRLRPKPESTFGRAKKPFKSSGKNRSGSIKKSVSKRNPLVLPEFYKYVRDIANLTGCDAHHWVALSKLKQDVFLSCVPFDEHRAIHAQVNGLSPSQWALEKGFNVLVEESMTYFMEWCLKEDMPEEYFILIEELKADPMNCHDIAKDFIFNNRGL